VTVQTKLVPLIEKYCDFHVVSIEAFLNQEIPPMENILSLWLPSQGLAMVYMPRGVGKTYSYALGVFAYAGDELSRMRLPNPRPLYDTNRQTIRCRPGLRTAAAAMDRRATFRLSGP